MVVNAGPVSLSSVDNNLHGLGYRAAELLDQIISGMTPPAAPIVVPPIGVVQRQSTNVLAVADEELSMALKYIENHFAKAIRVSDVANQTTPSSRRLQDRFTEIIGRTISEEIMRCRLDLARQLLRETETKLETIAERAGFGNAAQMTRVFARELGTSPARYRKSHAAS